jgi:hypothetical protein
MGLFDRVLKGVGEARDAKRAAVPPAGGAPSSAGKAKYDEVSAPGPGGEAQRMTRQQFESLPLESRVRLLVQGTLRFYRDGQEIPATEAMRSAY